jgi:hypothetical protein
MEWSIPAPSSIPVFRVIAPDPTKERIKAKKVHWEIVLAINFIDWFVWFPGKPDK